MPIIISSAYSDYRFSVEKYFFSMFSFIFIIIHLGSKLSLWQRRATQVLTAAVLIPQTLNGGFSVSAVSHSLSMVKQENAPVLDFC